MLKFSTSELDNIIPSSILDVILDIIKTLENEFDIFLGGSHYMGTSYYLANNPKLKSDIDFNLVKTINSTKGEWIDQYKSDIKKLYNFIIEKFSTNLSVRLGFYHGLVRIKHNYITIDFPLTYKMDNVDWVLNNVTGEILKSWTSEFYDIVKDFVKDEDQKNTLQFMKAWIATYRPINIRLPKGLFLTILVISNFEKIGNLFQTICKTMENIKNFVNDPSNFENNCIIYNDLKLNLTYDLQLSIYELCNIIDQYLNLQKKYGTI